MPLDQVNENKESHSRREVPKRASGVLAGLAIAMLVLPSTSDAQMRVHAVPAKQSPDEVRETLRRWGWSGWWAMDCSDKYLGPYLVRRLGGSGYPLLPGLRQSRPTGDEHQIVAVAISSEGLLDVVTQQTLPAGRMTSLTTYARQGNRSWIWFSQRDFEATENIPPNSASKRGMLKGQHATTIEIDGGSLLNAYGQPGSPAEVMVRCEAAPDE